MIRVVSSVARFRESFIQSVDDDGDVIHTGSNTVKHLQGPLNKFLQNIVELLLFKDFDSDLTEAASEALLSLICSQNVRFLITDYLCFERVYCASANERGL